MEAQAGPLRQYRLSTLLAHPWAARLIATVGIVVMTVGLYAPCAGSEILFHADPVTVVRSSGTWMIANVGVVAPVVFHVMLLPLVLGQFAVYALITFGGLALLPLLWRPLSPRRNTAVRWIYAIWLALLTLLALARLPDLRQFLSQLPTGTAPQTYTLEAAHILPGVVVFPLGVLISCAALTLMLREQLPLESPAPASRTRWQWASAVVLTVGVLVWGIGFYLMPEAVTATCPTVIFSVTQFAHGACAGLDSDQVRAAAGYAGIGPIASMLNALGNNFALLVATGCITALGGWTRHLSVATLAWLATWPALALGVAFVALQGVDAVAQRNFRLTVASGADWHMASGMVVTFAGIGLVVLGQLGLWRELVRRHSTASTQ
jgi:hypothetical protein